MDDRAVTQIIANPSFNEDPTLCAGGQRTKIPGECLPVNIVGRRQALNKGHLGGQHINNLGRDCLDAACVLVIQLVSHFIARLITNRGARVGDSTTAGFGQGQHRIAHNHLRLIRQRQWQLGRGEVGSVYERIAII